MTKRQFQEKRTKIIRDLIINSNGSDYPTNKCFKQLDKLYDKMTTEFTRHYNDLSHEKSRLQSKHGLTIISLKRFCERMEDTGLVGSYREFRHLIETDETNI